MMPFIELIEDWISYLLRKLCRNKRPQISLLVPFRPNRRSKHRLRVWRWLKKYWKHNLPEAEIVMGDSWGPVFSKAEAVNNAARQAKGRIFIILDADCYIEAEVIRQCVAVIEATQRRGGRIWFMPYRNLYRLTEDATECVLRSSPKNPVHFPSPPDESDVESVTGSANGHYYGALIQIMPREAFEAVGYCDERFKGWGGEDVSFLRAVDTLYAKHKSTDNDVLHLWHDAIKTHTIARMWEGQTEHNPNSNLAERYGRANGDYCKMRKLVDEAKPRLPPPEDINPYIWYWYLGGAGFLIWLFM